MKISRFALAFLCLFPGLALAAAGLPEASQLFRQGQTSQALEKVNAYLAANPKDAQARFLKGLILADLNKPQEAIKVFNELTDDFPELPEPYNNLAVLYAAQGQYERAKSSLEKAIRTHPSYATAHENLGDIYAKMASVAYDKALQLDKGNASAQMKLALVKDIFTPASVDKPRPTAKPGTVKTATMSPETSPTRVVTPPAAPATPTPPAKQDKASAAVPGTPEKTVEAWAAAWSSRDVPAYLSFYATEFQPAGTLSRADWEAQRQDRLTRPEYIRVGISDLTASSDGKRATVKFKQTYESNLLTSNSSKTLTMEKQASGWKITSER